MGTRDVNFGQARSSKTKTTNAQQKMSPVSIAKTPPNTVVSNAVGELQDGKVRIAPQETDDDRIASNEKHGEDRITSKKPETGENDEERILSDKNEGEDRIPPATKKPINKRRTLQKPYAEICSFDDTDGITLYKKQNYNAAITI